MSAPPFSKDSPNKIGNFINVSGRNTLIKAEDETCRVAIADEPIDTKVDGKKFFCARVDKAGSDSSMMFGFTQMETFDSMEEVFFGRNGFTGCGFFLCRGTLCYPVNKDHNIIAGKTSKKAKEIIVILTISNNGKKKEIQFLCDGNETKCSDISEHLNGDLLFH
jgi:hypothetical protein